MTTTQTQLRRGTSAQVASMTPVDGEPVYNTTDDRLHMGDGTTAGGIPHATAKDVQNDTFRNGTVGGTANAITLTNTPPVLSYANKLTLKFKATSTNTGATTVNVDGLGTKNIYKLSGTSLGALSGGEIVSGAVYELNYDGTQFQLGSGGSGGGAMTLATSQSTASGSSVDFTGIPATAALIYVVFNRVSLTANDILIQIGDSGGVETSGYESSADWAGTTTTSTSGFIIRLSDAGSVFSGIIALHRTGTSTWIAGGTVRNPSASASGGGSAGNKTLSGTLDRVRVTCSSGSFDNGDVTISHFISA